jgi:hypothetical protein
MWTSWTLPNEKFMKISHDRLCHSYEIHKTNISISFMANVWEHTTPIYEGVSRRFRTGCMERELQMVRLSATRCSCIVIVWISLVSFGAITPCVASQRVCIVVSVYFVIDSVRKLLDTPSYTACHLCCSYHHHHRFLSLVPLLLNQWCTPPLRLQVSDYHFPYYVLRP